MKNDNQNYCRKSLVSNQQVTLFVIRMRSQSGSTKELAATSLVGAVPRIWNSPKTWKIHGYCLGTGNQSGTEPFRLVSGLSWVFKRIFAFIRTYEYQQLATIQTLVHTEIIATATSQNYQNPLTILGFFQPSYKRTHPSMLHLPLILRPNFYH